jgi:hypothetical protein
MQTIASASRSSSIQLDRIAAGVRPAVNVGAGSCTQQP